MTKRTFTIFTEDDKLYGYLFDVTCAEAQATVTRLNEETDTKHYYMDGFINVAE